MDREDLIRLEIEDEFAVRVPGYRTVILEADVRNSPTTERQRKDMNDLADAIASRYKIEDIKNIPGIAATRRGYKATGKDPNRYRPSQEQLHRRVVRGLGLYNVNAIVDAGNQFSLLTGHSIGLFDRDKIRGEAISLGIGKNDEPYEGIGRGPLNIEGIPVIRDSTGGFGTPTSDNERTRLELDTTRLLATIHLFDPEADEEEVIVIIRQLLETYGGATNIRYKVYSV